MEMNLPHGGRRYLLQIADMQIQGLVLTIATTRSRQGGAACELLLKLIMFSLPLDAFFVINLPVLPTSASENESTVQLSPDV